MVPMKQQEWDVEKGLQLTSIFGYTESLTHDGITSSYFRVKGGGNRWNSKGLWKLCRSY